jgi:DNA-binding NtrC family response regulator
VPLAHRWPGNVRELENVVERAATLARGRRVTLPDLRVEFAAATASGPRPTVEDYGLDYIRRVVAEAGGDKRAAARVLGISVRTLQRKLR